MSIIIKNSQINNDTIQALNNLIELDINASVAFRLMRIIKELSSIVDDKLKMEKKILEKKQFQNPQIKDINMKLKMTN